MRPLLCFETLGTKYPRVPCQVELIPHPQCCKKLKQTVSKMYASLRLFPTLIFLNLKFTQQKCNSECEFIHRHNLTNNNTEEAKSTMGVRSQIKEASQKKEENWLEPVLNTHTFPPLSSKFFISSPSTQLPKIVFVGRKNKGGLCLPPQVMPMSLYDMDPQLVSYHGRNLSC